MLKCSLAFQEHGEAGGGGVEGGREYSLSGAYLSL